MVKAVAKTVEVPAYTSRTCTTIAIAELESAGEIYSDDGGPRVSKSKIGD